LLMAWPWLPRGLSAPTAKMTVWSAQDSDIVGSACEYAASALGGRRSPAAQGAYIPKNMYCAGDGSVYEDGAGCGACYELEGPASSQVVQIVDHATSVYQFECHMDIYEKISGQRNGFVPVAYKQVPCKTDGCAVGTVLDNPNPAYTKMIFSQLKFPVASVTAKIGDQKVPMDHNNGAVWTMLHQAGGPVGFDVTDSQGHTVALGNCLKTIWPISCGDHCKVCSATTTTRTTTTITSTTATTRTSTSTSTSTGSHPIIASQAPVVAPPAKMGSVADAALPNPFFDRATVVTKLVHPGDLPADALEIVAKVLSELSGLPPPCPIKVTETAGTGDAAGTRSSQVEWSFDGLSHEQAARVRSDFDSDETSARMNDLIADAVATHQASAAAHEAVAEHPQGSAGSAEAEAPRGAHSNVSARTDRKNTLTTCFNGGRGLGAIFCCERVFVQLVIQNVGVVFPYRRSFAFSIVMACLFIALQSARLRGLCWRACGWRQSVRESERGVIVMQLFLMVNLLNTAWVVVKSFDKFSLLTQHCLEGAAGDLIPHCPPSGGAMLLEVVFFGCLPAAVACMFVVWWRTIWREDCRQRLQDDTDPSPAGTPAHACATTPLEAVLRRSLLLSHLEVRPGDLASKVELVMLALSNFLLSFLVVLTSFFMLHRYEFPGRFMAWNPYKVLFESLVAALLKYALKKAVLEQVFGKRTQAFLIGCIAVLLVLDGVFWVSIIMVCVELDASPKVVLAWVLDIAVGAGLMNMFTSSVAIAMSLHLFSVYVYEPTWRRRRVHIQYLRSPEDIERLKDTYLKGDDWQLLDEPHAYGVPVEIPGLSTQRKRTSSQPDGDDDASEDGLAVASDGLEDSTDHRDRTPSYPSEERPVVVQLTRRDLRRLESLLLFLADKAFSVDRGCPLDVTLHHPPELQRPALLRFWNRSSKAFADVETPTDRSSKTLPDVETPTDGE